MENRYFPMFTVGPKLSLPKDEAEAKAKELGKKVQEFLAQAGLEVTIEY